MKSFSENLSKYFWFSSGFAIGLTLISLGHAALPKRATPQTPAPQKSGTLVSEMRGGKVNSPELDQDFDRLATVEGKYAENWDQQQRLRSATARVAHAHVPLKKKAKR